MKYEDFKKILREEISSKLENSGMQFVDHAVTKNNGVKRDGFHILHPDKSISRNWYYNEIFDLACFGTPVKQIAEDILSELEKDKLLDLSFSISDLNHESADENLFAVVVNAAANREMLQECPHKLMEGGLAVCARFRVHLVDEDGSFLVNNKMLPIFQMTREEVIACAIRNTSGREFICQNVMQVTGMMMNDGMEPDDDFWKAVQDELPLYVLTLPGFHYGASALACREVIEKAVSRFDDEVYIVPSSVHELLLVPKSAVPLEDMQQMLHTVNANDVAPEEILSERVFSYDLQRHKLLVAGEEPVLDLQAGKHIHSMKM